METLLRLKKKTVIVAIIICAIVVSIVVPIYKMATTYICLQSTYSYSLRMWSKNTYDKKGKLLTTILYYEDGTYAEKDYEYDENADLVKETLYNIVEDSNEKELSQWTEYEYDDEGYLIRIEYNSNLGQYDSAIEYEYDVYGKKDKLLTRETHFNSENNIEYYYVYDYSILKPTADAAGEVNELHKNYSVPAYYKPQINGKLDGELIGQAKHQQKPYSRRVIYESDGQVRGWTVYQDDLEVSMISEDGTLDNKGRISDWTQFESNKKGNVEKEVHYYPLSNSSLKGSYSTYKYSNLFEFSGYSEETIYTYDKHGNRLTATYPEEQETFEYQSILAYRLGSRKTTTGDNLTDYVTIFKEYRTQN